MAARLVHFLRSFIKLLGAFGKVLALLHKFVQIPLPLQQLLDALMKNNLGLFDFPKCLDKFIGLLGVLVALELDRNALKFEVLVLFQLSPLVACFFEKDAKNFI